jgi:Putative lumazine-binding
MRIIILVFVAAFVISAAIVRGTDRTSVTLSEEAAARVPLEDYIKGHETGKGDFMRKAFYSEAKIMAFRDGKLVNLTLEEFASRMSGQPAADESQRKRRIDSVEITGNAGIGKITLEYPTVTFTDYMSLLKIDGTWKIVNKVFHAEPKPKS